MTLPRISVALCTYNGARYLQEQLDSMLIQTRLPDELVVCDDGSKDGTIDILEQFRKVAPFPVRIVHNEQNLKMAKNFEKCIGLCTGDYIAPSDFDDAWYPNKLEVLARTLDDNERAGYVVCDNDLMDENGKRIRGTRFGRLVFPYLDLHTFPSRIEVPILLRENMVYGSAMLIRATLRRYLLPFANGWTQDSWIGLLACLMGDYGIAIDDCLMKYRIHASQDFGVHPRPWKLLPYLQKFPQDIWEREVIRFKDIRETIRNRPDLISHVNPAYLKLLDEKIEHLVQRARARASRGPEKWKIIYKEARTGRYGQFSFSWKSILREFVI